MALFLFSDSLHAESDCDTQVSVRFFNDTSRSLTVYVRDTRAKKLLTEEVDPLGTASVKHCADSEGLAISAWSTQGDPGEAGEYVGRGDGDLVWLSSARNDGTEHMKALAGWEELTSFLNDRVLELAIGSSDKTTKESELLVGAISLKVDLLLSVQNQRIIELLEALAIRHADVQREKSN